MFLLPHTREKARILGVGIVHIELNFPFFFHGSTEKFNQLAKKKNYLEFFSRIKTIVVIKFPKKKLFFFLTKIGSALKGLKPHLTLNSRWCADILVRTLRNIRVE